MTGLVVPRYLAERVTSVPPWYTHRSDVARSIHLHTNRLRALVAERRAQADRIEHRHRKGAKKRARYLRVCADLLEADIGRQVEATATRIYQEREKQRRGHA